MMALPWILGLLCAAALYRAGRDETGSGVLWGALSLGATALVVAVLQGGLLALGAGQVAVLVGIALWRVWRDPD
jgi:hypothetical protein